MSKVDTSEQPRREPSFRRITPGDGAKYLEGMIAHCLSFHSEIVPWLSGSIDTDMLEFPPEWLIVIPLHYLGLYDDQGPVD